MSISYLLSVSKRKLSRTPLRNIILGLFAIIASIFVIIELRIMSNTVGCDQQILQFRIGNGAVIDEYTDFNENTCTKPIFDLDTKNLVVKKKCGSDPLNFFLLWSTKREDFKLKHFRVIDSIFTHHPNARLHVITSNMTLDDFKFYTNQYDIVHHYLDTDNIFKDTPLERWAQNIPQYKSSSNYFSHLTDAMRLALLWKYGGVYLDTDAVVIRNLENVRNALGVQHTSDIASGEINGMWLPHTFITV